MNKIKRLIASCLLICVLFLCCGCTTRQVESVFIPSGSLDSHTEKVAQMEQTGDSTYISGVRTGRNRYGMVFANHMFECTDDGAYFLGPAPYQYILEGKTEKGSQHYLFFAPHDSDQIIKLCGRPDCTHYTERCNAAFPLALGNVTYFDGHLYIMIQSEGGSSLFDLYRIDPDGTNRLKVGSFGDRSQYSGWERIAIIDGVLSYNLTKVDNDTGRTILHRYYFALDGSMPEPVRAKNGISSINQEMMDVQIGQEGDKLGYMIYRTDIRNDEWTFAFDAMDYGQGYWGRDAGYVMVGQAVTRVWYEDGREETLFETGLEGQYHPRFFPDCIVLTQTADAEGKFPEIPMVYFYSWDGECLGELPIDFEYDVPSVTAIMGAGETKDKIYLWTTLFSSGMPQYYIDKADFGTGHIELRTCQYPDLTEEDYLSVFRVQELIQAEKY